MKRSSTPQFTHEFALAPTPHQARVLAIRFQLARQMYNAMLGEAAERLNRCKSFHAWKQAQHLFGEAKKRCMDALPNFQGTPRSQPASIAADTGSLEDARASLDQGNGVHAPIGRPQQPPRGAFKG